MKLEYLADINLYKSDDNLIRLFDFDSLQAKKFQDILNEIILKNKQSINLTTLDFIESVNCELTLKLGDKDKGIQRISDDKFECQLTEETYQRMITLIHPFVEDEQSGYQWLYDLGYDITPTEFLFSPGGYW